LEWTNSFWHIQNEPKGFQKLSSLGFLVAFVELSLHLFLKEILKKLVFGKTWVENQ
jgi:hypothetical protein